MDGQAIVRLKQDVMDAIKTAAGSGETLRISALAALAEEMEGTTAKWQERFRGIIAATPEEAASGITTVLHPVSTSRQGSGRKTDRKLWGKKTRQSFADLHQLIPRGGVEYSTQKGGRVAMAAAREDQRGNKWFLGLSEKKEFSCLVLLCEAHDGLVDFVIPTPSISNIWPRLSRSGSEVKLNIKRENGKFFLLVPDYGPFDITGFRSRYTFLN
jgi:hypothetical protein